ncbi:MAG: hypothetical protein QNJ30_20635 [Kiloniellales bacterium]|nr:hypothetical protein [Kiloniellales bacterium]
MTLEVDNPHVTSVIDGSWRPSGLHRIPPNALSAAPEIWGTYRVIFQVRPRNSTLGLKRANHLDSRQL